MIKVTIHHETHTVDAIPRPPLIYLDHWALRYISDDSSSRERVREVFEKKGTLLFSWANVLEVAANSGASLKAIQFFLSEIGEHWFPVEFNPFEVIRREKAFTHGNSNPCCASGFLKAYYPHISDGPLSLRTVCDLTQDSTFSPAYRQEMENLQKEILKTFRFWRSEKLKSGDIAHFDPNRPTVYVVDGFRRLIQKETFKIGDNDAIDFLHSTVPVAYSDFVLLDGRWADLAGKLKLPLACVRVYSPRQVERFLEDLEQFEGSELIVS